MTDLFDTPLSQINKPLIPSGSLIRNGPPCWWCGKPFGPEEVALVVPRYDAKDGSRYPSGDLKGVRRGIWPPVWEPCHLECYNTCHGSIDAERYEGKYCLGCGQPILVERYQEVTSEAGIDWTRYRSRRDPITCCSRACAQRVRRRQKATTHLAICVVCHSQFEPKRKDAQFCSPACRQRAHRRRHEFDGVT